MHHLDNFSSKTNRALSHMTSIGNYPSLVERLREIHKESNKPFYFKPYGPPRPILGLLRLWDRPPRQNSHAIADGFEMRRVLLNLHVEAVD